MMNLENLRDMHRSKPVYEIHSVKVFQKPDLIKIGLQVETRKFLHAPSLSKSLTGVLEH